MIIILLIIIFCAYMIQSKLYERFWTHQLMVTINFQNNYIYEGESAVLSETIINRKVLPLPLLQVAFSMDRDLEFEDMENANISDKCYKRDIFAILFYQKIVRELPFRAKKRGFYQILEADLSAHDVFQNKYVTILPQNTAIYVYPKQIDVNYIEIPYRKIMGTLINKKRLYEDPFEFRGIREYQSSDPMNSVNWKASARTGNLMVNTNEATTSQKVTIFLDLESPLKLNSEALAETSIQLAASLSSRLLSDGVTVSLISNGRDQISGEVIEIRNVSNSAQMIAINRNLARIDLKKKMNSMIPAFHNAETTNREDSLLLLISINQHEDFVTAYEQLVRKCSEGIWVLPLHPDMEMKVMSGRGYDVLRLEVEK